MQNSMGYEKTMMPGGDSGKASMQPGDVLGQYKIIRLLGRGGMGEVYEVEHQVLHRRYALKLLPPDFATRPGALERFQREAEVMANLEHDNILQVDDFGESNGRYWLRMELANGVEMEDHNICSLQEYADLKGGKIDQELLAGILSHILKGLQYAHSKGAIHRDLKPANILFTTDKNGESTFKIADFGLVRLVGEDWVRGQAQLSVQQSMSMGGEQTMQPQGSSTRSMLGTYEYMSPEQKRGEEADQRSDIYSLGLMAFKLLTGRELGMKRPSELEPSLVGGWDNFCADSLDQDPAQRIGNCGQLLERLKKVESDIADRAAEINTEEIQSAISKEAQSERDPQSPPRPASADKRPKQQPRSDSTLKASHFEPAKPKHVRSGWIVLAAGLSLAAIIALYSLIKDSDMADHSIAESVTPDHPESDSVGGTEQISLGKWDPEEMLASQDWKRARIGTREEYRLGKRKFAEAWMRDDPRRVEAFEQMDKSARKQFVEAFDRKMMEKYPEQWAYAGGQSVGGESKGATDLHNSSAANIPGRTTSLEEQRHPDLESEHRNSLGMEFVPVPGLDGTLFCKWETRVSDFRAFVEDRAQNGNYNYRSGSEPYILRSDGWKRRGWEYGWDKPGFKQTEEHPVTCVSWEDAQAFCKWLTKVEREAGKISRDQEYRLPRDWEWSVAVGLNEKRNGTPKDKDADIKEYPWGSDYMPPPRGFGNYAGSEAKNSDWPSTYSVIDNYRDDYARIAPVTACGPQMNGLYHMGGNVWEWCEDYYDGKSGSRVLRGASWSDFYPRYLLSSYRSGRRRDARDGNCGFRCVLSGSANSSARSASLDSKKELDTSRKRIDSSKMEEQRVPTDGEDWTSPSTGMEFVWIDEMNCWVGKYEVTNAEYRKKEPDHDSKSYEGYSLNNPRQPVVYVNFDDAKAYAEWMTQRDWDKLDGLSYRLPSEEEWMKIAQCGRGWEYPWGDNWPPRSGQAGNYDDETEFDKSRVDGGYRDGHLVTCDVEESWANPWGLYGVGGNVWEVCAEDKRGSSFGAWRGVSWRDNYQVGLRCSYRVGYGGSARGNFSGFRLLLSR
jgi:serine/threonine protein kinase/formylglycine-generating enzyme required for sulfatase activity